MVATDSEWASAPLRLLQARFDAMCRLPGPGPVESDEAVWTALTAGVEEATAHSLTGSSAATRPPSGALVRFRGMVQDVFDQEMYLWRYAGNCTSLASDEVPLDEINMQTSQFGDRLPVYCVSVPAETDWCRAAASEDALTLPAPSNSSRGKRQLEDDQQMMVDEPPRCVAERAVAPLEAPKRNREAAGPAPDTKVETVDPDEASSAPLGLNLPIHSDAARGSIGVLLKLYSKEHMQAARLNQVFDVVGVVSYAGGPGTDPASPDDEELRGMEQGRDPSGLMIPRIHVLGLKIMTPLQTNPLMAKLTASEIPGVQQELLSVVSALRSIIVDHFASVLAGDRLAAEYLLLAIVARVQARPGSFIVGRMPLNLVLPPSVPTSPVIEALQSLLARVAVIPVTIEGLNAALLYPSKDYSENRLRAAPLQQTDGTLFVLDETLLQEGQLAARGVENVSALRSLCSKACVPCDFKFYKTELPISTPVVLLSRGGGSMVHSEFRVDVHPSPESLACTPLSHELLGKLRMYLALVADGPWDLEIPEATSKLAEESFVAARQNTREGEEVRAETLEEWLTVARLSARSQGENVLSMERWNTSMEMEGRRRQRVKKPGHTVS